MWDYRILGIDLYHIIQWFVIYSFLGWVWETCYVSVKSRRFVNRGFVNGPFCTILWFWGDQCISDLKTAGGQMGAVVFWRYGCGYSPGVYYGGIDGNDFPYHLVGLQ